MPLKEFSLKILLKQGIYSVLYYSAYFNSIALVLQQKNGQELNRNFRVRPTALNHGFGGTG